MQWKDVFAPSFLWAHRLRIGATVMFAIGLGATIWLAFAASSESPPSGAQSALLALVSAVFQFGGAWAFSKTSATPPGSAGLTLEQSKSVARDMGRTLADIQELVKLSDAVADERDITRRESKIGELNVALVWAERHTSSRIDEWLVANPRIATQSVEEPEVTDGASSGTTTYESIPTEEEEDK